MNQAPAIERLGVPEYNWWSEGLHGLARAGIATVFADGRSSVSSNTTETGISNVRQMSINFGVEIATRPLSTSEMKPSL